MALTKGTNSYVDVSEADAYFDTRMDAAAWGLASTSLKEQALVTATSILDDLYWVGTVVSETQLLAFPRTGAYFDPKIGTLVSLPDVCPDRIVRATFELAYHMLNNDGLLDENGTVQNLKVGTIELSDILKPDVLPIYIRRIIKPLRVNSGSTIWFRAN
jgi:hypothetical protein